MDQKEFRLPDVLAKSSPRVGLVLGSGLGSFVDRVRIGYECAYSEIDGLPQSNVPGHEGRFVGGELGGLEVLIAQGRVHVYEGWSAREAASHVRIMAAAGVEILIVTNAAGIVNGNFKPGRWMLLSDHLNLARHSPLTGGPNFIDQSTVYCPALRALLKDEQKELGGGILHEGVYAWVNGPEYETPAEIRMLRTLGADAVGMSTVPEAIQARALGLKVVGFSCLTNYGAGLTNQPLSHSEVMETGEKAAGELCRLLEVCIPAMVEIDNE